ncbi:Ankrd17, partial [Symbiodinium sp. KB8]
AQGSEWTARVVLNVHAAGLLIGRGGKRIKMLQEDSGAQMQFFQGTDAPKGFGEEALQDPRIYTCQDRLVELRGPPVELQDGLELLLSELARVPEALAPRCAQLLVPEDLKEECCEEALKFGASRANLGAALGDGERLLALEGDTAAVRGSAAVAVTAMLCRRLWKPGQPPPSYRRREAPRSDSEPRPALPSPLFASAEKAAQLLPWSLGKPSLGDPPHQKEEEKPTNYAAAERKAEPRHEHLGEPSRALHVLLPYAAVDAWVTTGLLAALARAFKLKIDVDTCRIPSAPFQVRVSLTGSTGYLGLVLLQLQSHLFFWDELASDKASADASQEEVAAIPTLELTDVSSLKHVLHQTGLPWTMQKILHDGRELADAAKLESPMDVQLVLMSPADPDTVDSRYCETPLTTAARRGRLDIVGRLLEAWSFKTVSDKFAGIMSSLLRASSDGSADSIRVFFETGIKTGWTNTHSLRAFLNQASDMGNVAVVRLLLDAGEGWVAQPLTSKLFTTSLSHASCKGNLEILGLLLGARADPLRLETGCTAISCAASKGNLEVLHTLLEFQHGKNDDRLSDRLGCALLEAAGTGHEDAVQCLLQSGADKDFGSIRYEMETALFRAADKGHVKVVQVLLDAKAQTDRKTKLGMTALLVVCSAKPNLQIARLLLEAEADVDQADADGNSCLILASTVAGPGSVEASRHNGDSSFGFLVKGKEGVGIGVQQTAAELLEGPLRARLQYQVGIAPKLQFDAASVGGSFPAPLTDPERAHIEATGASRSCLCCSLERDNLQLVMVAGVRSVGRLAMLAASLAQGAWATVAASGEGFPQAAVKASGKNSLLALPTTLTGIVLVVIEPLCGWLLTLGHIFFEAWGSAIEHLKEPVLEASWAGILTGPREEVEARSTEASPRRKAAAAYDAQSGATRKVILARGKIPVLGAVPEPPVSRKRGLSWVSRPAEAKAAAEAVPEVESVHNDEEAIAMASRLTQFFALLPELEFAQALQSLVVQASMCGLWRRGVLLPSNEDGQTRWLRNFSWPELFAFVHERLPIEMRFRLWRPLGMSWVGGAPELLAEALELGADPEALVLASVRRRRTVLDEWEAKKLPPAIGIPSDLATPRLLLPPADALAVEAQRRQELAALGVDIEVWAPADVEVPKMVPIHHRMRMGTRKAKGGETAKSAEKPAETAETPSAETAAPAEPEMKRRRGKAPPADAPRLPLQECRQDGKAQPTNRAARKGA